MIPETSGDLLLSFRRFVDDNVGDLLWTDEDFFEYADQAQREFARETLCFPDYVTFAPQVTAGNPLVALDERIVKIRRGRLPSALDDVKPVTLAEVERGVVVQDYGVRLASDWERLAGVPRALITDLTVGYGRLVPTPITTETLQLAVYREPLEFIEDEGTDLEIERRWRLKLLPGIAALAYQKQDAEAFDMGRAAGFVQQWQAVLADARRYYTIKLRPAGTTGYGGI